MIAQRMPISELVKLSPAQSRNADIGRLPKGIKLGDFFPVALLNHTQAVAQNFTRILIAAAFDQGINHRRLSVGQDDIAGGHLAGSKR